MNPISLEKAKKWTKSAFECIVISLLVPGIPIVADFLAELDNNHDFFGYFKSHDFLIMTVLVISSETILKIGLSDQKNPVIKGMFIIGALTAIMISCCLTYPIHHDIAPTSIISLQLYLLMTALILRVACKIFIEIGNTKD